MKNSGVRAHDAYSIPSTTDSRKYRGLSFTTIPDSGKFGPEFDEDYYVFTAGSSGVVRVTHSYLSPQNRKHRWETSFVSGAWSDENGDLWIPVVRGYTYRFGVVHRLGTGRYRIAYSYAYTGMIPVAVSVFSVGYDSSRILNRQANRKGSCESFDRLRKVEQTPKREVEYDESPDDDPFAIDVDLLTEIHLKREKARKLPVSP